MSELVRPQNRKSRRVTAAAALAGGLFLGACSGAENQIFDPEGSETHSLQAGAVVREGVNFRHDPTRLESEADGLNNSCYKGQSVVLGEVEVQVVSNIDDPNAPWLGITLKDLPDHIQDACAGDVDDIIWVAKAYTSATEATAQN